MKVGLNKHILVLDDQELRDIVYALELVFHQDEPGERRQRCANIMRGIFGAAKIDEDGPIVPKQNRPASN